MSNIGGMCTGSDVSLLFGNHLVLTDIRESVIIGDATNGLALGALVTLGYLRVEPGKGTLTVKTLRVGSGAELTSNKDVEVTESLILQGELNGELDESSTIKTLTYGSRATDLVKKIALTDTLDALSIQVGSGELRLDEVVKTRNLGLCSGTLSLVDAESTTDSTLHVTEQITVQNGMLAKDSNDPGSLSTDKAKTSTENDRYILTYITPGKRTVTDALEWFDPRDVIVDHAKAEIMVPGNRSLPGKLDVLKGTLIVDGELTVGTSPLDRTSASHVDRYSVVVAAGELHTKGQDVIVHGKVTVNGTSKLMTGGGDLQVLGRGSDGAYAGNTARVTVGEKAMMNLGAGTLMLRPATTAGKNLRGAARPQVLLALHGTLTGNVEVPKGSKITTIAPARQLRMVTFDGTATPGTGNQAGALRLLSQGATNQTLVLDSLLARQGYVNTGGTRVTIKGDVLMESATIFPYSIDSLTLAGNLTLRGTGGLNSEFNSNNAKRTVLIRGNFIQEAGRRDSTDMVLSGVKLHPSTTKMVLTSTVNLRTEALEGDFHEN